MPTPPAFPPNNGKNSQLVIPARFLIGAKGWWICSWRVEEGKEGGRGVWEYSLGSLFLLSLKGFHFFSSLGVISTGIFIGTHRNQCFCI
jgi:hypothetical protein